MCASAIDVRPSLTSLCATAYSVRHRTKGNRVDVLSAIERRRLYFPQKGVLVDLTHTTDYNTAVRFLAPGKTLGGARRRRSWAADSVSGGASAAQLGHSPADGSARELGQIRRLLIALFINEVSLSRASGRRRTRRFYRTLLTRQLWKFTARPRPSQKHTLYRHAAALRPREGGSVSPHTLAHSPLRLVLTRPRPPSRCDSSTGRSERVVLVEFISKMSFRWSDVITLKFVTEHLNHEWNVKSFLSKNKQVKQSAYVDLELPVILSLQESSFINRTSLRAEPQRPRGVGAAHSRARGRDDAYDDSRSDVYLVGAGRSPPTGAERAPVTSLSNTRAKLLFPH
ncbi:hypothetical protein EVAR_11122_1 [Eumeta japonica]|uniref:Uncharacterized protein n=1 Tax=Eumeta variegata TaxID=151549 RepID=A0A4C1U466_EUMVA|nr:hypothetical protein EVAR_11122_1 [Eumeta japonica]